MDNFKLYRLERRVWPILRETTMKERKREDWKWKRSVAVCWSTWSNRSNSSNGHSDGGGGGGGGSNGSFSGRPAIIHHEGVSLPLRPETTSYDILRAATASFLPFTTLHPLLSSFLFHFPLLCCPSPPSLSFFLTIFLGTRRENFERIEWKRNFLWKRRIMMKEIRIEKEYLITICKKILFF